MIDRTARNELAANLKGLVTGKITNDEFDEHYNRYWHNSPDTAVAEAAAFGWGLYSDASTYRLKGRYAVSEETRLIANRVLLFLATDLPYEWPVNVRGVTPYWWLWGPGCYLAVSPVLVFIGLANKSVVGLLLGVLAAMPTFHWLFTHKGRKAEWKRFCESHEFHVWPFARRQDFDEAQRRIGREFVPGLVE